MKPIIPLAPGFAVTGVLEPADFAEAARLGYRTILSNLPDGEMRQMPTSQDAARLAADAGLAYRHIPATRFDVLSDAVIGATLQAVTELPGPILAHCASGMRSAIAWGGAAARFTDADAVLATLGNAGFNLAPLKAEFAALRQADAGDPPPALTVEG